MAHHEAFHLSLSTLLGVSGTQRINGQYLGCTFMYSRAVKKNDVINRNVHRSDGKLVISG